MRMIRSDSWAISSLWVIITIVCPKRWLVTHTAHLVLEEPLERLAQLEFHVFGQAAHVVVALDDFARDVEAFDAVGVASSSI